MVRTLDFQSGNRGSIPLESAKYIWMCANVVGLGRAVTPLPYGLVGSNPTTSTSTYSLMVRTTDFQSVDTSSILVRCAKTMLLSSNG